MDKDLLDLYTDYLISSFGQITATGLSALLDNAISHDRITRLLSGRDFTSAGLWQAVKPLVRQVPSEEAVLIIHDSVEAKPYPEESELFAFVEYPDVPSENNAAERVIRCRVIA